MKDRKELRYWFTLALVCAQYVGDKTKCKGELDKSLTEERKTAQNRVNSFIPGRARYVGKQVTLPGNAAALQVGCHDTRYSNHSKPVVVVPGSPATVAVDQEGSRIRPQFTVTHLG